MTKLTQDKHNELIECEEIIESGVVAVGNALIKIRDRKLYVENYSTFDEYCKGRWDFTREYGYRLINGAKAVKSLPPAQRKEIKTSAAAIALANVPAPQRRETVEKAAAEGNVTAKTITASAPKRKPKDKPKAKCDNTGLEIPMEILGIWNEVEEEATEIFSHLAKVINWLKHAKNGDGEFVHKVAFVEIGLGMDNLIAKLSASRDELETIIPHAVCPQCNGILNTKDCVVCSGRGFVSKFYWNTFVPQEMKDLRNK